MLESIWIENFKSYKTGQTLPLAPITLMIGANASGKSNAIEAFRFLSWFASGEKLSTIQNRINDSEKIFRGDVRDLFSKDEETITLGVSFADNPYDSFDQWKFMIGINEDAILLVIDEYLKLFKNNEKFLYVENNKTEYLGGNNDLLGEFLNKNSLVIPAFEEEGVHIKHQTYDVDSDSSILKLASIIIDDQLKPYFNEDELDVKSLNAKLLRSNLKLLQLRISATIKFYDFIPSKMRNESISASRLNQNGQNLSGVLYKLWENQEVDHKNDILKFISSLPEQDFKTLKFYKDHRDRVELALVENFGGQEQEWGTELLSDGTLRVLGIAAAILSASRNSTIVIEEIDNGIHPSRAKYLLETMFYFAEKKNLRLLLSTHNPALMDALPDKALGDVVFAYRDPKDGDSRLVRLSDLDDYVGLVSQGPLGELVTQGIVDRFVKNPISKDDKKQKALSWLNEMRGVSDE
ncbi:AAA family ATPase [Acinetobacter sp. YH12025]|uniref:AAA family ATPase n=1 Tax=Acinetobacter sp. YH12025 TaxID=2601042 RepID=UPI0015D37866|nr:AAA family ATPase [Acinetobacter sp. YH12025]